MNKYLIVIIGPTAIGKTNLSIQIANYFGCEIISADSRQFYKEMSIGTAVPDPTELNAANHHFIQNISIEDAYSVGDFEKDSLAILQNLYQKNNKAVLVGGSGLYVDAVLKGLDYFPEVFPGVREDLMSTYEEDGIVKLQNQLKELDPYHYDKIDLQNPHRLIRALEICISTGKPYSSFLSRKKDTRDFKPVIIGLTADREIVYNRINRRVDLMIENGLIEEARSLYPKRNLNALNTVGYKELFKLFDGEWDQATAISEIKKNTRRFAKRQFTWFKKVENVMWYNYQTPVDEIFSDIEKQIIAK